MEMTQKGRHCDPGVPGELYPASWEHPLPAPALRLAEEIRNVLADPRCGCTGPVYSMFRGVTVSEADRRWLEEQDLRFDITVIPPRELCGEYVKTAGHFHPPDPRGTGYPEIYEVLAGEAHYLIQTPDCSDVVMIVARKGDVVVVPSGYGHVTINPSKNRSLEMANIVSSRFASEYRDYETRRGAVWYEMADGTFVRNPAYPCHPSLRFSRGQPLSEVAGTLSDPLYELIRNRDPVLEFLNYPEKHTALFQDLYP